MESVMKELKDAGIDVADEIADQQSGVRPRVPQIKIEHSKNGKHAFFFDMGTGDDGIDEVPDAILNGVVVMSQHVRAWWPKDSEDKMPECAAIEETPYVEDPVSPVCKGCQYNGFPGECKPKVRVLMLTKHPKDGEIGVVVFNIPTTSIKKWDDYIWSLKRWPLMAINTQFTLEDKQTELFRYAIVIPKITGIADQELRDEVKKIREKYSEMFTQVGSEDFEDAGDHGSEAPLDETKEVKEEPADNPDESFPGFNE